MIPMELRDAIAIRHGMILPVDEEACIAVNRVADSLDPREIGADVVMIGPGLMGQGFSIFWEGKYVQN